VTSDHDPRLYSSGMMASVPVIRGTWVSLPSVIEYLREGRGLDAFLADHPQVTPAQATWAILAGLEALVDRREAVHQASRAKPGDPAPPRSAGQRNSGEV
jgi:uncharacterized protein (DUF433 family)